MMYFLLSVIFCRLLVCVKYNDLLNPPRIATATCGLKSSFSLLFELSLSIVVVLR